MKMKEGLEKEIKTSEEAIKSMNETIEKCTYGIFIQELVLEKFREELGKL